ncbi:Lipase, partial [Lachnellula suecica]
CNVADVGPWTCISDSCSEVEAAEATSTTEFLDEVLDIACFVAVDPTNKLVVVAFRGTDTLRNWLEDILFLRVACSFGSGCTAHAGFLLSWASVQSDVFDGVASAVASNPEYEIIVTGHSLGGAIATLAGASLRDAGYLCDIYTYGSPRIGNDVFANDVTAQAGSEYRVTHFDDPVPRLPPILDSDMSAPSIGSQMGLPPRTITRLPILKYVKESQIRSATRGLEDSM